MVACSAFGCENKSHGKEKCAGKSFHVFPNCKKKRKQWLTNIKRENFKPTRFSAICSDHFVDSCIDRTGQIDRLREDAVPTLFKLRHLCEVDDGELPDVPCISIANNSEPQSVDGNIMNEIGNIMNEIGLKQECFPDNAEILHPLDHMSEVSIKKEIKTETFDDFMSENDSDFEVVIDDTDVNMHQSSHSLHNISQDLNVRILLQDNDNSTGDKDLRLPSLGLQSWAGPLDFSMNFVSSKFSNSKWCYSSDTNKLYIMRTESVPIEICMDVWQDCILNITPVFLNSQHIADPVLRCHNHRIGDESRGFPNPAHIIEVVNPEAKHEIIGGRYSVEIPLGLPAPGESSKIVHVQPRCWNTCFPTSKRNCCMIFTLFSSDNREIGRHVIHYKSCESPLRDMGTDVKKHSKAMQNKWKFQTNGQESRIAITEATQSSSIKGKEPFGFESLLVISAIAPDVKRYINCLMASRFAKQSKHFIPPYPNV